MRAVLNKPYYFLLFVLLLTACSQEATPSSTTNTSTAIADSIPSKTVLANVTDTVNASLTPRVKSITPSLTSSVITSFSLTLLPMKSVSLTLLYSTSPSSKGISSVAISPDDKIVAAASQDGLIKIYSVLDGKELVTLQAHNGPIRALVFAPDGKTLVSGGNESVIKFWSVGSWKLARQILVGIKDIERIVFSPDNTYLALIGTMKYTTFQMWSVSNGQMLKQIPGFAGFHVKSVAFSSDSKTIALGTVYNSSVGSALFTWSIADMISRDFFGDENVTTVASELGEEDTAPVVAFSSDGKLLASAYEYGLKGAKREDQTTGFKIWSLTSRQEIVKVSKFTEPISWLAFSTDNQTLCTASEDEIIQVWNVQTGQELFKVSQPQSQGLQTIALSQDSRFLVTGHKNGITKLWEIK